MIHLLFALLIPISSLATELGAISPNNQGVKALIKDPEKPNTFGAYQKFAEAAAEDSFDPVIRLNMGFIFSMNKEPEKALAEYKMAEEFAGENKEVKFMAQFNQGVELGTKGDIPGALMAYQRALEISPDSKEVKNNIELLWQQQQGKGGGKGQQQNKGKNENGEGGESDKPEEKPGEQGAGNKEDQKQKPQQPKPFDSKELTPETVRKVLDELKSQEQKVRADHYSRGAKERPRDKQW